MRRAGPCTVAPYGAWDSPLAARALVAERASFHELAVVPRTDGDAPHSFRVAFSIGGMASGSPHVLGTLRVADEAECSASDYAECSVGGTFDSCVGRAMAVLPHGRAVVSVRRDGGRGTYVVPLSGAARGDPSYVCIPPDTPVRYTDFELHPRRPRLVAAVQDQDAAGQPVWLPDAPNGRATLLAPAAQVQRVAVAQGHVPADVQPASWKRHACMAHRWQTHFSSTLVAVSARHALVVVTEHAHDTLVLLDLAAQTQRRVASPFTYFAQLHIAVAARNCPVLVCFAGSPQSALALAALPLARVLDAADTGASLWRVLHRVAATPLDADCISMPEPIAFPSLRPDGSSRDAFALVYPPKNPAFRAPPGSLPPCRIVVHDGPTARMDTVLSGKIQYWTTRGWLGTVQVIRRLTKVCALNYAGSTGYGYEYMRQLNGAWGVTDASDCIAAAAYLGGAHVRRKLRTAAGPADTEERRIQDRRRQAQGRQRKTPSPPASPYALVVTDCADGARRVTLHRQAAASAVPSLVAAAALGACMHAAVVTLETRRGLFLWRRVARRVAGAAPHGFWEVHCARRLVPREHIRDFFLVEGLHRWQVVDYAALATVTPSPQGDTAALLVVFPHLFPPVADYIATYRSLHDRLMVQDCGRGSGDVGHGAGQEAGRPHTATAPDALTVDPARICLVGHGAGGFTVLRALANNAAVFSAACTWCGIYDLHDLAQHSSAENRHYVAGLLGGDLHASEHVYTSRSPITDASHIVTPLLLLESARNALVPSVQGSRMADAVRAQGGNVRYVELPGDGCGTSGQARDTPYMT
ncbi:hypothetical protein MSPP1_000597 [Malassezia sp. CBS 17886]|nr:hypothetical protein MSPP1_000597 [Malassezia sp. CBS 17886]